MTSALGPDVSDHVESFVSNCGLSKNDLGRMSALIAGEISSLGADPDTYRDKEGQIDSRASFLYELRSALDSASEAFDNDSHHSREERA